MIILLVIALGLIFLVYWFRSDLREMVSIMREKPKETYQPATTVYKYNILERVSKSPVKYYHDDYALAKRMTQKIADLNDQLIRDRQSVDGFQLDIKDVLRYQAMVDILRAMLAK